MADTIHTLTRADVSRALAVHARVRVRCDAAGGRYVRAVFHHNSETGACRYVCTCGAHLLDY